MSSILSDDARNIVKVEKKDVTVLTIHCYTSVTNVKGLLQTAELDMYFTDFFEQVHVLCDSAYSRPSIFEKLAKRLKLQGPALTLSV